MSGRGATGRDVTPEGDSRRYGIMARIPKEVAATKRSRAAVDVRGDVAKVLTAWSTCGESISRRDPRQNLPAPRRAVCSLARAICVITMYRKASADQNGSYPGVEWQRHDPLVRSNLRALPCARPPIAQGHFPGRDVF